MNTVRNPTVKAACERGHFQQLLDGSDGYYLHDHLWRVHDRHLAINQMVNWAIANQKSEAVGKAISEYILRLIDEDFVSAVRCTMNLYRNMIEKPFTFDTKCFERRFKEKIVLYGQEIVKDEELRMTLVTAEKYCPWLRESI